MPITSKQTEAAQKIDAWVRSVEQRGGGEAELLQGMANYMPVFKQLLDTATPGDMDALCQKYRGFFRFAKLLDSLAKGIANGTINVPK